MSRSSSDASQAALPNAHAANPAHFSPSRISLDDTHTIVHGSMPSSLSVSETDFDEIWSMHPDEFPEIMIQGRLVRTPRWQQAFGRDYRFSGKLAPAEPVPDAFIPIHNWVRSAIDERLNGILVNWYDGRLGHYIGRHRDSRHGLIAGAPIVTVSLGEERIFRLRPWPNGKVPRELRLPDGAVVILPYSTNLAWTHEVPHRTQYRGRRISLTFRCFET